MSERIDITRQLFDEMLQRKWAEGYDAGNGMMLKAVATAELLERKRIIKLLEEAECQGEDDWCGTIKRAIALIKGEK